MPPICRPSPCTAKNADATKRAEYLYKAPPLWKAATEPSLHSAHPAYSTDRSSKVSSTICLSTAMRSFTSAIVLLGGLLSFTQAVVPAPVEEKVLTPAGYRPKAKVHSVPAGGRIAHIGTAIHVIDAAGAVVQVISAVTSTPTAAPARRAPVFEEQGYIAFAFWLNPGLSPIASYQATWAYGPSSTGGGEFWAMASWFVFGLEEFFVTPLVEVNPGAVLNVAMTLTGSSDSAYNYTSSFTNVPGTSLAVTIPAPYTSVIEALESYNITGRSDYPAGTTVFSNIALTLSDGSTPDITWITQNDTQDGVFAIVNVDGAVNGTMTIKY
ncbi:hypothetical protein B0H13DRAFT_2410908 [Mycena leptocephala]|nr:hypothetical protein B0H13DRAFT_2410908 [Mycena leptocephala]